MANGIVEITGQSEAVKNAQALEMKREEEMTDAFGNTVKVRVRLHAEHDILVPPFMNMLSRSAWLCYCNPSYTILIWHRIESSLLHSCFADQAAKEDSQQ